MPSGEERESLYFNEALLPDAVITQHCETDTIRAEMWQPYPLQMINLLSEQVITEDQVFDEGSVPRPHRFELFRCLRGVDARIGRSLTQSLLGCLDLHCCVALAGHDGAQLSRIQTAKECLALPAMR